MSPLSPLTPRTSFFTPSGTPKMPPLTPCNPLCVPLTPADPLKVPLDPLEPLCIPLSPWDFVDNPITPLDPRNVPPWGCRICNSCNVWNRKWRGPDIKKCLCEKSVNGNLPLYFAWNILFKSRAVRAMFWDVKNISSDIFSPFQSECCADWLLKMSNLHERHFIFNLNLSSAAFWWQRREKSTISRSPIDALMLHIWNIAKGTTDPRVDRLNKIQLG